MRHGECPGCGHHLEVPGEGPEDSVLACPECATLFPLKTAATRRRVLVAHESEAFLATASRVLSEGGFEPVVAADGEGARASFASRQPDVLVLDVALPGAWAFDWIPALRGDPATAEVVVVLVASVYDKTAYKRRPVDLHGADDYVEQHHVPDALVEKLQHLLSGQAPPAVHREGKVERPEDRQRAGRLEEAARVREERLASGEDGIVRLVRLVLSDLALYQGTEPGPEALAQAREEIARRLGGEPDPAAINDALASVLAEMGAAS